MEPQATNPAPTPNPPQAQQSQTPATGGAPKTNTMAIFGLILAFIIPVVGLILSIVAKSQIKKRSEGGSGLATAGIVISIVVMLAQLGLSFLLVLGTIANVQEKQSPSNNSGTSSGSSSTTDTSKYSADEKKAVSTSEAFIKAIKAGEYSAAYALMGPELKKEYSSETDFENQVKKTEIKINSWKVESATTNGSSDRVTVKGSLALTNKPPTGTFEFGYYKDADGSIRMYLWEIRPTY